MTVKYYNLAVLLICVFVIAVSVTCRVNEIGFSIFGFKWQMHCLSKHIFGINCALCGMTHSFCALGHGNLAKALEYHKMGVLLFFFILFQIPYRICAITLRSSRTKKMERFNAFLAIVVLAALIINWLIYLGGRII